MPELNDINTSRLTSYLSQYCDPQQFLAKLPTDCGQKPQAQDIQSSNQGSSDIFSQLQTLNNQNEKNGQSFIDTVKAIVDGKGITVPGPSGKKQLVGEAKFANAVETLFFNKDPAVKNAFGKRINKNKMDLNEDKVWEIARGGKNGEFKDKPEIVEAAKTYLDPSMKEYRDKVDGAHPALGYMSFGLIFGPIMKNKAATDGNVSTSDARSYLEQFKKDNGMDPQKTIASYLDEPDKS